jgi:hypothetical protein
MIRIALFAAAATLSFSAIAQKAHVHGEGKLDVAIEKDTITLNLELPLDATVGFERAPKNDKEKSALVAMEKALKDAASLWLPTAVANCTVQTAEVLMPKFDGGEHADTDARYVFRCANPSALKGVETSIFKSFKRLYRIEAQRVGPSGQGKQRLTPKNPVLTW